jgi:hypothetical protein
MFSLLMYGPLFLSHIFSLMLVSKLVVSLQFVSSILLFCSLLYISDLLHLTIIYICSSALRSCLVQYVFGSLKYCFV